MNCYRTLTPWLLCLLLCCGVTTAQAQAQNLRAATSSSYIERGNQWFTKGEYVRAEADFTQAIELQPQLADAYAQRGLVRLLQHRADEAQADSDRCLERNPQLRQSLERMITEAKRQLAAKP